jgi:hypothetical protein
MNSFRDTGDWFSEISWHSAQAGFNIRQSLRSFGKILSIFGSISCLCNSTMRQAQQDGYQQSGAPKRVLLYTFTPAEDILED